MAKSVLFTAKEAKRISNRKFAYGFTRVLLGAKPKVKLYPLNEAAPPQIVRQHWHATRYRTRRGVLYERLKRIRNCQVQWVRLIPKDDWVEALKEAMSDDLIEYPKENDT